MRKRRCSRGGWATAAAAGAPGSGRAAAPAALTGAAASVGPAGVAIDLGLYLARRSHGCTLTGGSGPVASRELSPVASLGARGPKRTDLGLRVPRPKGGSGGKLSRTDPLPTRDSEEGAEDVSPGLDRPRVDRWARRQGAGARPRPGRLRHHHSPPHRRRPGRRLAVDAARLRRPRRRPGPAQPGHRSSRRDRAARPVAPLVRPEVLTRDRR